MVVSLGGYRTFALICRYEEVQLIKVSIESAAIERLFRIFCYY